MGSRGSYDTFAIDKVKLDDIWWDLFFVLLIWLLVQAILALGFLFLLLLEDLSKGAFLFYLIQRNGTHFSHDLDGS